jgi:basic membrane protein A and related proteins
LRLAGKNLCGGPALALLVALVLAACGGSADGEGGGDTAEDGERSIRVGLVTDIGQLNDRGFNQLAFEGLQQAERELGVEGRVIESSSDAEYVPNLSALAEDGYDLVIGVGYAQGEAVAQVAREYPDARFLIVDVDQEELGGTPGNVVGLLFREEEVGYLAGYLAGRVVAREPGPDVLGSVGGMKEPPVDRFIAGYQAGARAALPEIRLLNSYSQDWDDLARCKEAALAQIGDGARVVFQVAGGCGLGALDAAQERDVWGIGVDADQSFLGPHILTSAMKRVDRAVFLTIESVVDESWEGGRNAVFGLEDDGVGLGTTSDRVHEEDLEAVEDVRRRIVAGEIADIPTRVG